MKMRKSNLKSYRLPISFHMAAPGSALNRAYLLHALFWFPNFGDAGNRYYRYAYTPIPCLIRMEKISFDEPYFLVKRIMLVLRIIL